MIPKLRLVQSDRVFISYLIAINLYSAFLLTLVMGIYMLKI
jgi:hypothetical protein